jgi:HlyD family secretion protein
VDKTNNKWLFVLAFIGILGTAYAAYFATIIKAAEPPVFNPASNPYPEGVSTPRAWSRASSQAARISTCIPRWGTVKQILVSEGQPVKQGQPLLLIDTSIQRATQSSLRDWSQWEFTPRTASWATFSRPYGTDRDTL